MSDFKNKLYYLVAGQLPAYIRDEYPKFVTFLEEYYKFLETDNQAHDILLNSEKWSDIETTLDDFIPLFLKQYAYDFPQDSLVDHKRIVKYIHSYYEAKGSENATEMFFRFMYNDSIEVVYPGDNILRASDGRWSRKRYFKVDTQIFTTENIFDLEDKQISVNYIEFVNGVGSVLRSIETNCFNVFGQAEANIYQLEVDFDPSYIFPSAQSASTEQILGSGSNSIIQSAGVYDTKIYVVYDGAIYGSLTTQIIGISSIDSSGSLFREDDAFQIEEKDYGTATSGTSSTLFDSIKTWSINIWQGYTVSIIDGYGVGQTRTITSNTLNQLTVSPNWSVTPDATSDYRINGRNSNALVRVTGIQNNGISSLQIVDSGFRFTPSRLVAGESSVYFLENYLEVNTNYVSSDVTEPEDQFVTSIFPNTQSGTPATVTFDLGLVYEAGGTFKNSSGFLSDINGLQDNYFYQPYSYVIRTTQPQQKWADIYSRSNHPSGFKMFSELQFSDTLAESLVLSDSFKSNDFILLFDTLSFNDAAITFDMTKVILSDAYVLGEGEGAYFETGENYTDTYGAGLSDSLTRNVVAGLNTFTGTDGTAVTAITPDLGWSGWAQPSSGPTYQIQSNRLQQTTAPFGGRAWAQAIGSLAFDNFKVYADLFVGTLWGSFGPQIGFKESLSDAGGNPIRTGHTGFALQPDLTGTAGAGRTTTIRIQRDGLTVQTLTGIAIPDFDTIGRRFIVEVAGSNFTVRVQPAGGGADEYSSSFTVSGELYNTAANSYFGLIVAAGTPRVIWDNFTVETQQTL